MMKVITYKKNEKIDKVKHGIFDIDDCVHFGTGINDKSSKLQRMQILVLGTVASLNCENIKSWAKKNGHTSVGYKEVEKFMSYCYTKNPLINNYNNLTNMRLDQFYKGLSSF